MEQTLHRSVSFFNTMWGVPFESWRRFNVRMDLPALRRKNLRLIVNDRFAGNAAAFGRFIDRSQSQVADLLAGRKSFGEKTARYIEQRLRIEPYTLDQVSMTQRDPAMTKMIEDLARLNARNLVVLRVMMDGLIAGQADNDDNGNPAFNEDGRTDGRTDGRSNNRATND